jgi:hypothetical protein
MAARDPRRAAIVGWWSVICLLVLSGGINVTASPYPIKARYLPRNVPETHRSPALKNSLEDLYLDRIESIPRRCHAPETKSRFVKYGPRDPAGGGW